MVDENRLEVRKVVEDKIIALQLDGIIDESFSGKQLAEGLKETLIVDLSGVRRISSFGIREWLEFLKIAQNKTENIYYIKVPSRLIDQFNMVANFGGKGQVLSFYAPYHCDFCDEDHSVLVDVQDKVDVLKESTLPDQACDVCGEAEYLDEDPESFLSYLSGQEVPEPDSEILAFLSHRLRYKVSKSRQKLKIDMHISEATYIRFMGDLDASFQGKKIAEGKEGKIIFDLNGVGDISDEAVDSWIAMMQIMEPNVENIYILGASHDFIEKLLVPQAMAGGKVKIVDLFLPYSCSECHTTIDQNLSVDKHFEVLKFATAPELKCPDCGGKCNVAIEEKDLTKLSSIAKPEFEKNLQKFVNKAKDEIKKASAPAKAIAEGEIKASNGISLLIAMVFIFAVVGVGGFFLFKLIKKKNATPSASVTKISSSMKVRPSWVKKNNKLNVSKDGVSIITIADDSTKPDQGIQNATGWAIDLYVESIADKISAKDPIWKTIVRGLYYQPREDLLAQYRDSAGDSSHRQELYRQIKIYHKAIAKSFKLAFGKDIVPTPENIYWEKFVKKTANTQREFYKVWIKLDFPANVTSKMVKYFATKVDYEGVTFVNFFPGLNWAFTKTVRGPMVLSMKAKSKFSGILKVGYVLTQLQNEPLSITSDFKKKFESLYALQKKNNRCDLTFHYKFWRNDAQDVLASTSQYNWKCPEAKVKTKIIIKNGGSSMNLNTGFQGNIWNDPSK